MKHDSTIAVLGLGNILLRDEGVGVRVIETLQQRYTFSPPVTLIDGGTLGFALINEIADCKIVIVVDAVKAGNEPGTIYRFTRNDISLAATPLAVSVHDIGFLEALDQWKIMGINPEVIFLGIEPEDMSSWGMELSDCIKTKIPILIDMVINEIKKLAIHAELKQK
jgi:hydrogenase maturation protease